jgi:hypothetical protein
MASARRWMADMTQPEAPPQHQQQRSRRYAMAVGGICADLHTLLSSDAEGDEGPHRVGMVLTPVGNDADLLGGCRLRRA